MPAPAALQESLSHRAPADATCLELSRDSVLRVFVHPVVNKIFLVFAMIVIIAVVGWGLIISWAVIGLYLGVDNGWADEREACIECAAALNETLTRANVPDCPANFTSSTGLSVPSFCTLNQEWFNLSIKAFVIMFSVGCTAARPRASLFSTRASSPVPSLTPRRAAPARPPPPLCAQYINFLPIPWRLAILHHACCTHRRVGIGLDFYGRETGAQWFHIPRPARIRIAVFFNLSWVCHFGSLGGHLAFPYYFESRHVGPALAQNVPFVLSILFQIIGGCLQSAEENAVDKARGKVSPPSPMGFLAAAWAEWRHYPPSLSPEAKEPHPSLCACVAKQWRLFQLAAKQHSEVTSQRVLCPLTHVELEKKPASRKGPAVEPAAPNTPPETLTAAV